MAKEDLSKKVNKEGSFSELAKRMRKQNDSLRKLLEELSRDEKANKEKIIGVNQNQFNNSNK